MSNFKPSKFQQAIFDFIVKPVKGAVNAVISAVAGSGKTTTLVNAMALIPSEKSVIFMAFSHDICEELKRRVVQTASRRVSTIHAFGLASLRRSFKIRENDGGKYRKLLNAIMMYYRGEVNYLLSYGFSPKEMALVNQFSEVAMELNKRDDAKSYLNRVVTLCDLGRLNLVNVDSGKDMLTQIAYKHNVELTNGEVECALLLIKIGRAYTSVVDFTDMIYLPLVFNTPIFTFDFVFIDECQDLNTAQRTLMLRAINPKGGRFIAVGDERQAIYGFAGADAESFRKLQSLPNTTTLPLSVSYRCGKNIIALAKNIVAEIEPSETAKDGVVDNDASKDAIRSGDMVLCRQTFPLVAMCLMYLAKGVKAFVMGKKDIGESLIKMITNTQRKREEWTMVNVFARLDLELQKVIQNVMRKDKVSESDAKESSAVILYEEKIKVITLLSEGLENPNEVIAKITKLFSDDQGEGICFCTIHKSKGLEADRVFIIHKELMPSKYARKDWERLQEDNLRYVAYTRAKSYLGFVTNYDAYAENPDKVREKVEVKESQHIGQVGEKVLLEVEVVGIKAISGFDGECLVFDLKDKDGNLFIKMGVIKDSYIISNHKEIVEGTMLRCMGVVKAHSEWRGVKTTRISTLSKAK